MVATTELLDKDDEQNNELHTLVPWRHSDKLVDEAQLHVSTLSAFSTDIYLFFLLYALQFLRKGLRRIFFDWEKKYGRTIYDDYFRLIKGYYLLRAEKESLKQPLLKNVDNNQTNNADEEHQN